MESSKRQEQESASRLEARVGRLRAANEAGRWSRGQPARGPRMMIVALAPVVAALVLSGCGGGGDRSASDSGASSAGSPEAVAVQPAESQAQPRPQALTAENVTARPTAPAAAIAQRPGAGSPETLPPDIVVAVADTLVSPGEPVAFTVEGTPDVAEVVLWDGLNDRQEFSYDDHEKVWRVYYRVPLHPSQERLGLSVTARTEANRWRRLWVFLRVAPAASPSAGS